MAIDPYKDKLFKESPYYSKSDLTGRLVAVLQSKSDRRGLELIPQPSRCICKNQIHEFVCTDEENAVPGTKVNKAAYIGFVEFTEGGVMLAGDEVYYNDTLIGRIAGYDETHMPNHYNILMSSDTWETGKERGLVPGGRIRIHKPV